MEANNNNKRYLIELKQDGSFSDPHARIYTVNSNDILALTLDSTKLKNFRPILLSNYPKKNKKGQMHFPLSLPITSFPQKLSQAQIEKHYTCFPGQFNKEGSWVCELKLTKEVLGSLFLQVVFVDATTDLSANKGLITQLDIKSIGKPEWVLIHPQITLNNKKKDTITDLS